VLIITNNNNLVPRLFVLTLVNKEPGYEVETIIGSHVKGRLTIFLVMSVPGTWHGVLLL
jgi:hypothetical protein